MNGSPAPALAPGTPVLVTGATGFTGAVLVRKLVAMDAQVRAIARPQSKLGSLADLPVRWHLGDVADEGVIRAAAEGARYIFHLATAYRRGGTSAEEHRRIHVTSTQRLAEVARATPDFQRFVHVSTVGVHGHIEDGPADESAPFRPGDSYQETKAEAETWLRAFSGERAFPYTILRPAAIIGPGDKRLFKVFRMASRPVFPIIGQGRCLYHIIHVEDLADAILCAATHPAAQGEAFICGNAEPIPLVEMARTIAETLGRRLRVVRLPAAPFYAAADLCEALCRPFGIQPPLYRRRVAFFTKDRQFDTRKLRQRLGFTTRYDNRTGVVETTRWYRENGWL